MQVKEKGKRAKAGHTIVFATCKYHGGAKNLRDDI